MGITEILTIIFVVLKLIGKIDWSWWLVLLPEIIAFVVYAALIALRVTVTIQAEREIRKATRSLRENRW